MLRCVSYYLAIPKAMRNAVYRGIDGASHNPLIEKPEQTLEFIREFVK